MPLQVQVQCPAKVNLFLEVTGKRRDGYHTWPRFSPRWGFRRLDVERTDARVLARGRRRGRPGPDPGPDNLVLRAAEAFRKEFGLAYGARIRLTKRIPMGAGLGGSDAGHADRPGTPASLETDRSAMARVRRLARARRGRRLRPPGRLLHGGASGEACPQTPKALPDGPGLPGVHCPTPEAYQRLVLPSKPDVLTRLAQLAKLEKRLAGGRPLPEWGDLLLNSLEDAVHSHVRAVRQAKELLAKAGLRGVLMSGSGASVFGFAPSREEAAAAARKLAAYPWKVYLTCCLG